MIDKVLYLCDHTRCVGIDRCGECSHTSDIEHSNWDHEPTQEELDTKFRRCGSGNDTLYFEIET